MTDPNRRWFRFSLRTLFVVVTVFAVIGAVVAERLSVERRRESALRHFMNRKGGLQGYRKPITGWWNVEALSTQGQDFSEDELREMKAIFPEAEIIRR